MSKPSHEHLYWQRTAEQYDQATLAIMGAHTLSQLKQWLLAQIQPDQNILELACGTGCFSEVLTKKAGFLTASDLSDAMLKTASNRLHCIKNVRVQKEDCYALSFADEQFDGAFLGNLIHVISHPELVMKEVRRVLRPGGLAILIDSTSIGLSPRQKLAMSLRYLRHLGLPPRSNKILSPCQLETLVTNAGFQVTESELIGQETRAICITARKSYN